MIDSDLLVCSCTDFRLSLPDFSSKKSEILLLILRQTDRKGETGVAPLLRTGSLPDGVGGSIELEFRPRVTPLAMDIASISNWTSLYHDGHLQDAILVSLWTSTW